MVCWPAGEASPTSANKPLFHPSHKVLSFVVPMLKGFFALLAWCDPDQDHESTTSSTEQNPRFKARTCRSQSYSNPGGSNLAHNRSLPLAVTEESSRYHDISARKTRLSHLIWYGSVKYRDRRSLTCHPCNSSGQLPFSAEAMCSVQLLDCAPNHNEACPLYAVCLPSRQNHAMVVCMEMPWP